MENSKSKSDVLQEILNEMSAQISKGNYDEVSVLSVAYQRLACTN